MQLLDNTIIKQLFSNTIGSYLVYYRQLFSIL